MTAFTGVRRYNCTDFTFLQGFLTAPSSPSVNLRSLALGASLSLSNISAIGTIPEVKKRRAPPPPKPAPRSNAAVETPEEKITESVSYCSKLMLFL